MHCCALHPCVPFLVAKTASHAPERVVYVRVLAPGRPTVVRDERALVVAGNKGRGVTALAWAATSRPLLLAVGDQDGVVRFFSGTPHTREAQRCATGTTDQEGESSDDSDDSDGVVFRTSSPAGGGNSDGASSPCEALRVTSAQELSLEQVSASNQHTNSTLPLCACVFHGLLVCGCVDVCWCVWMCGQVTLKSINAHTGEVTGMQFHPHQAQLLLTCSRDWSARLLNVRSATCIAHLVCFHANIAMFGCTSCVCCTS